jgi:tRNA pseudouridine55 synthase
MDERPLAGFLNLLKPPGMTSHDVVYQVRRLLPRKTKVGHLGTLDPAATGVLPVAVGSATRLIPLLPDYGDRMKSYLAEIELGVTTPSDDLESEPLERCDVEALRSSTAADWAARLAPYQGVLSQVPPQVSAIRKDGQRAYERARRGQTTELEARTVRVARCDFVSWDPEKARLRFYLVCSAGTYVRSIARDLGHDLGVGGALAFLIRTHSGPFTLDRCTTLEELRQGGGVAAHLLPEAMPFGELPRRELEVVEKGRTVRGDFEAGRRYLASNGLLLGDQEPGVARVEAVFSQGVGAG